MFRTILADPVPSFLNDLEVHINKYCPQLNICGKSTTILETSQLIKKQSPALVFMEVEMPQTISLQILKNLSPINFEAIFISSNANFAVEAIKSKACGFLLKPLVVEDLIISVENAKESIRNKQKHKESQLILQQTIQQVSAGSQIGIPTIEGFDFFKTNEIIRCEGLQNCTRIITKNKKDIISSYSIGRFVKMLQTYGFFAPHKSHLINLSHIRKYYNEGTILMSDNSYVPVAKRRKSQFLKLMTVSR